MSEVTRRQLLTSVVAVAATAAIPAVAVSAPCRFGYMDVSRWIAEGHMGKRVLINGRDITDHCRSFDDESGQAECLFDSIKVDGEGNFVVETLRGSIEVIG